jgi:UMF1 family MFS transporter
MEFQEILIFAIGLNVTSGIGAFLFASMDDKHGAKLIIMASLSALIGLGIGIMIVDDKTYFIILALCLGIFIGPVQASSRSMMARLSPANMSAQMFGFYAMTGKSISFLGPLLFAILTQVFENQRAGIAAIIGLWIVGFILMLKIKEA